MRAVSYDQHGPPSDVLHCTEVDALVPGRGQAVVAMHASVIHPSDLLTIRGQYAARPRLPNAVPGNEGVGRVVRVGFGVDIPVGTRVLLPLGSGTWRDEVLVTAAQLVVVDEETPTDQLAMAVVNPITASLLLSSIIDLRPGEWVLQNAANSAVGQLVARLARTRGLRTVNVVRRATAERSVHLAGGHVVVMAGDDLADTVQRYTNGDQIRLALDAVAGSQTGRLAQCLAFGGTVVNYGALSGEACVLPPSQTIFRDIRLRGFWLNSWLRQTAMAERVAQQQALLPELSAGKLQVPIAATYPLDQITEAVLHAEQSSRPGKILVTGSAYAAEK